MTVLTDPYGAKSTIDAERTRGYLESSFRNAHLSLQWEDRASFAEQLEARGAGAP